MTVWIGRVEPSMWFEGQWWQDVLPQDVRLAILSLGVGRLTDDELERAHALILEKVAVLDREGVDVINVGGSPVVGVHGRAGHERLLDDIARLTRRPFVTALQAELEAIRAVAGHRVIIASPYPVAQTAKRVKVLEEEGFDVVAHDSLDIERNRAIAELDPGVPERQAVELAAAHPEADVIYMPCGSLPAVGRIAAIEGATGRPVVTCVQAQVHGSLSRAGYDRAIRGFGRLLEGLGAPAAAA